MLAATLNFLMRFLPAIVILLGLIMFLMYFLILETPENRKFLEVLKLIATSVLGAGVFSAILKSLQFSKVFYEEIEKVIYGDKFLGNRADLVTIWNRITEKLCTIPNNDNLAKICANEILENYLPISTPFYYKKLHHHLTIDWVQGEKRKITILYEIEFTIVAPSKKPITLAPVSVRNTRAVSSKDREVKFYNITGAGRKRREVEINPTANTPEKVKNHDGTESEKTEYSIVLEGQTEYKVKRVVKHIQDLDEDKIYNILTSKFAKGFELNISKPVGFEVTYFPVGLVDALEPNNGNGPSKVSVGYNKLIFPQQGVILVFEQ